MQHVWIPWREQVSRVAPFEYCAAWWRRHDFAIHLVDAGGDVFSLAASRNMAVDEADALGVEALVIADADTVGKIASILEALELTVSLERTVLPYSEYRSLGEAGTLQAIAGVALEDCDHITYPPAVSGIYVTTPAVWAQYGGQDPRFRGWLGEDIAHMHAHETLLGQLVRTSGAAFALGHESAVKEGPQYEANAELMRRYAAAAGDVDAMWSLVNER